MKYDVTGSIVVYKSNLTVLQKSIISFLNTDLLVKLYIIDNSPTNEAQKICTDHRIEYIYTNKNVGFGAGHNIAILKNNNQSFCHLILNPDVYFDGGVIEKLVDYLKQNEEVGVVAPKVFYPDGRIQYSCRLIPSFFHLLTRRNYFLRVLLRKKILYNNLAFSGYDQLMEVPFLLGCFLLVRTEVFQKVGYFDQRFFIYMEDLDFSRRILRSHKVIFNPSVVISHIYERRSAKHWKGFLIHFYSMIKYFNKWGWFFDKERKFFNKKTLNQIKIKQ